MAASLLLSNLAWPALAVGPADAPKVEEHVTPLLSAEDTAFTALADKYFDDAFKLSPCWATSVGFHQYDDQLEDYSAAGFEREAKMNRDYLAKLQAINADKLNSLNKLDRELLISHTKAELLSILEIQNWKRNPDRYSSGVTSAVFDLIKRDFAPLPDRMRSVIAREKLIPGVLAAGKENLAPSMVPPIFASIALEQLPGTISFFQTSLPEAFKTIRDDKLNADFKVSNDATLQALKDYQSWLKEKSDQKAFTGQFALGEDKFHKKLKFDEMVDTPIDKLLADGYDELHKQQKQFVELAKKVSPDQSVADYFVSISKDHPTADQLLPSVRGVLEEIRAFCIGKNIVTIPSEERARVEETPPFDRALTFASMDTPGAYEKKAREAYYFVTLPESDWPKDRIEEHLRSYSYPDLINTSVHEAYPGHYVQFLWSKTFPTKVRKLIGCSTNDEGWAHYCEQMMLDEGLRSGDPKLRMIQLHDALLRVCRYIVGIQMHCKGMSMDDGIAFFMKEGYMEHANAERETKRGTMDPTYLYYTLGKMQILALRDEVKKRKGDSYTLKGFHDAFLSCGFPPICIVRAQLLDKPLTETASSDESTKTK
jgi:uncharacterized protein (DUF885 family)